MKISSLDRSATTARCTALVNSIKHIFVNSIVTENFEKTVPIELAVFLIDVKIN
jgi:hypothetical protein